MIAFVPGDLYELASTRKMAGRVQRKAQDMPQIRFEDLEVLRKLVSSVELPVEVSDYFTLLFREMKSKTELKENTSVAEFERLKRAGKTAEFPYRASKLYAPRMFEKGISLLKAAVVLDWIRLQGQRPLEATFEDVAALSPFFTFIGPESEILMREQSSALNPHEKAQISSILEERRIFSEISQAQMFTSSSLGSLNPPSLPEGFETINRTFVQKLKETLAWLQAMKTHRLLHIREVLELDSTSIALRVRIREIEAQLRKLLAELKATIETGP
jgi:hypothetical protein